MKHNYCTDVTISMLGMNLSVYYSQGLYVQSLTQYMNEVRQQYHLETHLPFVREFSCKSLPLIP